MEYYQIILLIISLITLWYILRKIGKSQIQITDAIFWIISTIALIILCIFPQILQWGATLIGIVNPVSFVFLIIIFVLIIKLFLLSLKVSQLESKVKELAQIMAIDKNKNCEKEKNVK